LSQKIRVLAAAIVKISWF